MSYGDPTTSRNGKVLQSFIDYCTAHSEQRFWQALLSWSGCGFIFASGVPLYEIDENHAPGVIKDTFNWEGRNS
jgi:hypothetical protein